jgi:hypothetical protein
MGARWYDVSLARWTSADTLVPEPGNPQALNRYSYVNNQPLTFRDSSGHGPQPAVILGAGDCPTCWDTSGYHSAMATISLDPKLAELYEQATDLRPGTLAEAGAFWDEVFDIAASVVLDTGADACEVVTGRTVTGLEGNRAAAGIALVLPVVSSAALKGGGRALRAVGDAAGASGQWHHILSAKVVRALGQHEVLRGALGRNDFLVQAVDVASHRGYQTWHRAYDDEVVEWLGTHTTATSKEFLQFLLEVYGRPEMRQRFPNAVNLLEKALQALEESQ